jgi:hypothetical protein
MYQRKRRSWAASTGVVACVTAAAVLGTSVPATAAVAPASTPVSASSSAPPHGPTTTPGAAETGAPAWARPLFNTAAPAGSSDRVGETERSWISLIRTAINALKKVPALWKKLSDGVKKSFATFQRTAWPAIKAVVGTISTLITAWDIWKYFN